MVIYRDVEGKPGYHQSEELEEAVRYVESLRNGRGVEQARIFRMEEVTFEFRPYFRVELSHAEHPAPAAAGMHAVEPRAAAPAPAAEPEATPADPAPAVALTAGWVPEPVPETPASPNGESVPVGTGVGRRGLFGR